MLQLRSKAHFLAFGVALTSMVGLNATAFVEDNTPKTGCHRCQKQRLPKSQEAHLYKQMARDAAKAKKQGKKIKAGKNEKLAARSLCSKKAVSFPKMPQIVHQLTQTADSVTTANGAVWSIATGDQKVAQKWISGQPLTIVPNSMGLWSKLTRKTLQHKYRLVNLETKRSVQASLAALPVANNSLKIRKINLKTHEVSFSNGTLWKLDASKASTALLNTWKAGDVVLTGDNNTWFARGMTDIVINATTDNWIAAKRLY
jgi:hypothetical protein